jgi:hypothetical protein
MEVEPSLPSARKISDKTNRWLIRAVKAVSHGSFVNLSFTDFVNTALVTVAGHEGSGRMRFKRFADKAFQGCNAVRNGNM